MNTSLIESGMPDLPPFTTIW